MKKQICFLILVVTANLSFSQSLILNGDFEQYIGCPDSGMTGQFDSVLFWMNPAVPPGPPGGSPDYYHTCAPGTLHVPNNFMGYQQPLSGDAYCGIALWSNGVEFREYIGAPIITPLTAGNCYHFEMYFNLSNRNRYATDDIQIYFSDTAITGIANWNPLPYQPQTSVLTGVYPDSLNWTLTSANYIASGGEQYMIIGNFKNDSSTNLVQLYTHSLSNNVYIYIDNVSLTPCTGLIENSDHKAVNVFPSPFQEKLNITSAAEGISEVLIYDFSSRIVIQKQFTFSISLNTAMLPQGIYFYQVINNRSSHCSGKILKN